MSETTDKLCRRGSLALAMVNGMILLASGHQLHNISLHHGETPEHASTALHKLFHLPSVLTIALTLTLLAILIGKEWLRPSWLPLALNLVWLVAGVLLLLKLTALLA